LDPATLFAFEDWDARTARWTASSRRKDRPMTRTRYNAYRYLRSSLELADFTESEREILGDAAEGFLLARSPDSDEFAELSKTVVVTLDGVIQSGRMSRWAAGQAKAWIDACGPVPEPLVPALA
jgi:hypothetical protein